MSDRVGTSARRQSVETDVSATKSKVDWAIEHAELGIPVIPLWGLRDDGRTCGCERAGSCASPGKHPLTSSGVKDATTDRARIERWWRRWPDANIGGRTGEDWVVVDVDPRNGGSASLAAFEAEHGELPRTAAVRTGTYGGVRGSHFWFRRDGRPIPNCAPLRGVEVKAANAYAVLPGSTHASGVAYEWERRPKFGLPPSQLIDMVESRALPTPPAHRRLTGLPLGRRVIDALSRGLPHEGDMTDRQVAVGLARSLHESGHHEAIVRAVLAKILEHPASASDPTRPWTAEDVNDIVTSVVRAAAPDAHALASARAVASDPRRVLEASRVDLVKLIRDGIPARRYVPGCDPWLLAGKRYLIPAPAGTGKSLFALIVATTVVRAGGVAVILDVENGAEEYASRLGDILDAAREDGLARGGGERLQYHAWPALDMRWSPTDWADAVGGADLVIFDSSRLVLSPAALNEDKSDDYATFVSALLMPLSKAGIATMVLDNTGHGNKETARGTTAKYDLNEVVYAVSSTTALDRGRTRELRLRRTRTRFADVPAGLTVPMGGGVYGPVAVVDAVEHRDSDQVKPLERARALVALAVESRPGITATELRRIKGVRGEDIKLATDLLVEEGILQVRSGARGARHHVYVKRIDREARDA